MNPAGEQQPPTWLLADEVAAMARMHPQTVYRHMRDGRLRATQFVPHGVWRAHVEDVQLWLRGRRAHAPTLRRTA